MNTNRTVSIAPVLALAIATAAGALASQDGANHGILAPAKLPSGGGGGIAGGSIVPLDSFRVATGLAFPVFVAWPPGDYNRAFVLEKAGRIDLFDTTVEPWVFVGNYLDINSLVGGGASVNDERGLLGLAFDADFLTNGRFYVNYTNNGDDTVIARYTDSDPLDNVFTHAGGSPQNITTIIQPQTNHNGGWIGFGPNDGYLYVAMGDGGNFCDSGAGHSVGGNAQDITTNLLGKMLRIDVSGNKAGYSIPPDNPLVGITGDDEIWVWGLRNPWRNSFDSETGDLLIGDVGQGQWEEIDFVPDGTTGQNFGWPCFEGNADSSVSGCNPANCQAAGNYDPPIHVYSHAQGIAVTGGYVYRGCNIPSLIGTYFFADYGFGTIWSGYPSETGMTNEAGGAGVNNRTGELASVNGGTIATIASFGEDNLGEIYIVDQGSGANGEIFKIIPTGGPLVNCNGNNLEDACDLIAGYELDCNGNQIPDSCDIALQTSNDCNENGVPDECDIAGGSSLDCNLNDVPDDCEPDCNDNDVADECDITGGNSLDCNRNSIPDECEIDCNDNQVPDDCDISGGTSDDCNLDGVPDDCEPDCNGNDVADECDITAGTSLDCDLNAVPDECDILTSDCNANQVPDACDIASGKALDCNLNQVPDSCDIADGTSLDENGNGVPDECDDPPPSCPADIAPVGDEDGIVGPGDLAELLANWGPCDDPENCPADIAPVGVGDDEVGPGDLGELLASWGQCPP